jgi:hypothetical protein
MLTSSEKKVIREEFWSEFKTYSNLRKLKMHKSGKWIMNDTNIKQLSLKFHFDENIAIAGIEIETHNVDKRILLFDKLEKLKSLLVSKVPYPLVWELEKNILGKSSSSLVYVVINDVSIYNKNCWKKVFKFLFEVMDPIEDIFREYYDFLKYNE